MLFSASVCWLISDTSLSGLIVFFGFRDLALLVLPFPDDGFVLFDDIKSFSVKIIFTQIHQEIFNCINTITSRVL
jgi:hypothetical protein